MLTIAEEFFLLTLNDISGLPHGSINHNVPYGISASIFAELILRRNLDLDARKRVYAVEADEPEIDLWAIPLQVVAEAEKLHKLDYWVNYFTARKYTRMVPDSLVARKFLEEERKHYLWVLPYIPYPNPEASAKVRIKQDLRNGVLANAPLEARRMALLLVLRGSRMLSLIFTKDERDNASKQLDAMVKTDSHESSAVESMQAVESALGSAVTAAVLGG